MATERFGLLHSAALILISLCLLPINSYILLCSYALQILGPHFSKPSSCHPNPDFRRRKVVISGINTTNGLILARAFYQAGHHVIGTDCQVNFVPGIGRLSKAVKKYYALPLPQDELATTDYVHALVKVVEREKAELWISCSAFTSPLEDSLAKEVIERKTNCRCLNPDMATTSLLSNKQEFLQRTRSMGLQTPKSYNVTSRNEVHHVLGAPVNSSQSFTISKVRSCRGMESSQDPGDGASQNLPRRSLSETYQLVSEMAISADKPYVLEENVSGEKYITQAVVVRGSVEAFAACAIPGPWMHIHGALPGSGLHQAMLKFSQEFVSRCDIEITGFLSFTLKAQESSSEKGYDTRLMPVSCNPTIEVPNILFQHASRSLVQAITSILDEPTSNGYLKPSKKLTTVADPPSYHWSGQDFVLLVAWPTVKFLRRRIGFSELIRGWFLFSRNVLAWKDVVFEAWDPSPWFFQYHVYWPAQLLLQILHGKKWSKLDVITGQIYG